MGSCLCEERARRSNLVVYRSMQYAVIQEVTWEVSLLNPHSRIKELTVDLRRFGQVFILAQPALAALVVLHVVVASTLPRETKPEVKLSHILIAEKLCVRSLQHNTAVLHDIAVLSNGQSYPNILLH